MIRWKRQVGVCCKKCESRALELKTAHTYGTAPRTLEDLG